MTTPQEERVALDATSSLGGLGKAGPTKDQHQQSSSLGGLYSPVEDDWEEYA